MDRSKLPTIKEHEETVYKEYTAPQTPLEAIIVGILQEILEQEQISTLSNFFEVGATSLSMIRAHRQLEETLQRKIPVIDLFRYPTVESLATYLEGQGNAPEETPMLSQQERAQMRESSRRQRGPRNLAQ